MGALTVKEWLLKEYTEQQKRLDDFIFYLKNYDLTDTQMLEASKLFQTTGLDVSEIFELFAESTWED